MDNTITLEHADSSELFAKLIENQKENAADSEKAKSAAYYNHIVSLLEAASFYYQEGPEA